MDRIAAMTAFVRVVECGSFTRAADSLDWPKSHLTRLIQALETSLRIKLLTRTTRKVTVTDEGVQYYERVSRLLSELQLIEGELHESEGRPKGKLRVDVSGSIGTALIIPSLPSFLARYPDLQIELGVSDRPINVVADNVDCVIRSGAVIDETLVGRRIGDLRFVTCASASYLKGRKPIVHPSDLESDHVVVNYFSAHSGRMFPFDFTRDGESVIKVTARHAVAVNDGHANLTAGLAGLGVIQAPAIVAEPHLTAGRLVHVLPEWACAAVPVHAMYPRHRFPGAKLRVFIDWVAELAEANALVRRDGREM